MKKLLILLALPVLLYSCKKNDLPAGTLDGQSAKIEKGTGKSWIKLDVNGAPQQLGLTIDDAAINSLPTTVHESLYVIPLSAAAQSVTPFSHLEVNWNPHGHEPIYGKPHFDFHFYMVSESEVAAVTDTAKMEAVPHADYLPPTYIGGPSIAKMGKHFIDSTSPEMKGGAFTETFVYGTYDRKVTFYEPMITLEFLKSTTLFERPIPQPAKFLKAGNYPTKMRVSKHDGVIDIVLDGFVQRRAS
jgi:hypothetical protein